MPDEHEQHQTLEVEAVIPAEDMDRQALIMHMRGHHGYHYFDSKISKARLLSLHTARHADAAPESFLIPHDHTAMSPTKGPRTTAPDANVGEADEKMLERLERAKQGLLDEPLKPAERSLLLKLVANDFAILANQISQMGTQAQASAVASVEAEYADKEEAARKVTAEVHKAIDAWRSQRAEIISDAHGAGVELSAAADFDAMHRNVKATVTGKGEAISAARAAVRAESERAMRTLEAKKLATERTILMASVGIVGGAFLESLPSAQSLMLEAAAEETQRKALEGSHG